VLLTKPAGYYLRIDPGELDAVEFQILVASAEQLAVEEALAQLERALALWRGPALADFAGEQFALSDAARLNELHLHATEGRINAGLALGRHAALIAELVSLTSQHPLRERLCWQLMLALYRSGRQAEASDVYQRTRERLVDELGMEPGPELQALLRRILQQDPSLILTPTVSSLPSGTLTFLMTDIEESTRLWDASADKAKQALERHNRIVIEKVTQHDGQLVESGREGDSFLVVFRLPTDAVAAALAVQLAMYREDWPHETVIRVRVAVHTGQAELQLKHYVGAALYRCARLMATAHGGQVVISQATEELVADALPNSASLLDLGLHHLRDISRPEHVFQLLHADLPPEFPALKSGERARTNLPAQLTNFVGRERELRDVADAADRFRLVTLTGVGGTGKTRLAVQVGGALLDRFAEGIWFVDLTPLSDAELIPQAVASSLGIREQPGRELLATLTDHLRKGRTLLILDNCEHVINEAAAVTATLVARCSELHVLATSRERLRVDGEHVFQVPPMGIPSDPAELSLPELRKFESVQLFVDRAALSAPSFSLNEGTGHAVAQLCIKLDGIPLAIELAAAQIPALSPQEILGNLGDRFSILASGNRTGSFKQRTLWATLEWSYQLLSDSEQRLFLRLAVFAGGFDLEAAKSVGSDELVPPTEVVAVLGKLTDKSLVVAEPGASAAPTRYRLLETVREFAGETLRQSGEEQQIRHRHALFYTALGADSDVRVRTSGAEIWLDRLEQEHDNARAALSWSMSHDPNLALRLAIAWCALWEHRAYYTEGRQWLTDAQRVAANHSNDSQHDRIAVLRTRAHAKYVEGELARGQGDLKGARACREGALTIAETIKDKGMIAASLNGVGIAFAAEGDFEGALHQFERALAMLALKEEARMRIPHFGSVATLEATLYCNRGQVAACLGDYKKAREDYSRALVYFKDSRSGSWLDTYWVRHLTGRVI
jgi:predicted ATPase/class 3 adenylate cyclase